MVVADVGLGADLPRGPVDVEGGHVGASQRIAEGVVVDVGGRHGSANVLARAGVFLDLASLAQGTEHRCVVVQRVGPAGAGRVGPAGVAFGVGSANLYLIIRVRGQAGNGRGRARDNLREVGPGTGTAHSVLHVVAVDGGPAVIGRGDPGDRQAGAAEGHRRDLGRRGSVGRLGHVGDADGDDWRRR